MSSIIIGISGKQGSGKTTLAKGLLGLSAKGYHCKFADPLYDMHEAIRGVMAKYGRDFPKKDGKLLQLLGTEWGRTTMGENVWVDMTYARISELTKETKGAVVVVDDARFSNELDMFFRLKENTPHKVLTVRLECGEGLRKTRAEGWRDTTNHPSETGLDGRVREFDLVLDSSRLSAAEVLASVVTSIGGQQALQAGRKPWIPGGEA